MVTKLKARAASAGPTRSNGSKGDKDFTLTSGVKNPSGHHLRQIAKLNNTFGGKLYGNDGFSSSITPGSPLSKTFGAVSGKGLFIKQVFGCNNPFEDTTSTKKKERPKSAGAFKPRAVDKTKFRYFCKFHSLTESNIKLTKLYICVDERGDLPLRVNFAGAVRKIQWQVDVNKLDYGHYLPLFMEGLRELDEPYQFLALNGTLDLIEKGKSRPLACISQLILPMKQNLMTKHPKILCVQMRVLQKLVTCCPFAGEALVPYYRQLLAIFNLFITKRVNCGDFIDYGQRRQENLGDLIMETLYLLEKHGGPDAFVNIK
jgi:hypothetical protein